MATQIMIPSPEELAAALDGAAVTLNCTRDEVIRQAVEQYLEDLDDLSVAVERLRDPADPVLDWDEIRRDLIGKG